MAEIARGSRAEDREFCEAETRGGGQIPECVIECVVAEDDEGKGKGEGGSVLWPEPRREPGISRRDVDVRGIVTSLPPSVFFLCRCM